MKCDACGAAINGDPPYRRDGKPICSQACAASTERLGDRPQIGYVIPRRDLGKQVQHRPFQLVGNPLEAQRQVAEIRHRMAATLAMVVFDLLNQAEGTLIARISEDPVSGNMRADFAQFVPDPEPILHAAQRGYESAVLACRDPAHEAAVPLPGGPVDRQPCAICQPIAQAVAAAITGKTFEEYRQCLTKAQQPASSTI